MIMKEGFIDRAGVVMSLVGSGLLVQLRSPFAIDIEYSIFIQWQSVFLNYAFWFFCYSPVWLSSAIGLCCAKRRLRIAVQLMLYIFGILTLGYFFVFIMNIESVQYWTSGLLGMATIWLILRIWSLWWCYVRVRKPFPMP
jgi:hypothetical protein